MLLTTALNTSTTTSDETTTSTTTNGDPDQFPPLIMAGVATVVVLGLILFVLRRR